MNKSYHVKKGPADPFRGEWYIFESSFLNEREAIEYAAMLTQKEYDNFTISWEQYGYEWSVFKIENSKETKIWEGYKYITLSSSQSFDIDLGYL